MKILIRIAIGVAAAFLALAVLFGVAAGVWFWFSGGPTAAEQHLTSHLSTLSRDRDQLLDSFRDARSLPRVKPGSLPVSLRVAGVQYALIHEDHITLITYTSPDVNSGFRVWKSAMRSGFADRPTAIPFVTRFSYCNDYPDSPSNRQDQNSPPVVYDERFIDDIPSLATWSPVLSAIEPSLRDRLKSGTQMRGGSVSVATSLEPLAVLDIPEGELWVCEPCYIGALPASLLPAQLRDLHEQFAMEYRNGGRFMDARRACERALEFGESADNLALLACIHSELDQPVEAADLYRRALALVPDHFIATNNLHLLLQTEGIGAGDDA